MLKMARFQAVPEPRASHGAVLGGHQGRASCATANELQSVEVYGGGAVPCSRGDKHRGGGRGGRARAEGLVLAVFNGRVRSEDGGERVAGAFAASAATGFTHGAGLAVEHAM